MKITNKTMQSGKKSNSTAGRVVSKAKVDKARPANKPKDKISISDEIRASENTNDRLLPDLASWVGEGVSPKPIVGGVCVGTGGPSGPGVAGGSFGTGGSTKPVRTGPLPIEDLGFSPRHPSQQEVEDFMKGATGSN